MSERIAEPLAKLAAPVATLKHDPRNARSHDARNLEAIANSLRTFGQRKPIVARPDGVVLVGNGTLAAAMQLGWEKLAVVFVEVSDTDAALLALVDNRSQELSSFDARLLAGRFDYLEAAGVKLQELGFTDYEIGPLREATWERTDQPTDAGADSGQGDGTPPPEEPTALIWSVPASLADLIRKAIAAEKAKDPTLTDGLALVAVASWYMEGQRDE